MPETLNPSAFLAMTAAFLLSLLALFFLFHRHLGGNRPLLAYQPRTRVPWGPLAAMIPLFFLVSSVLSTMVPRSENIDPDDFILSGWLNSAVMLGLVLVLLASLTTITGANALDLGLPTSLRQLARDAGAGMLACIASLIPIYLLQFALHLALQPEQQHQLIEQLLEHRTPQMMLVGVVSSVIAAPVFEEFTFRMLLQGWLERKEDEHPERSMIASLPHGWTPILISSFAFGLAHVGHGVAPVPLVVFGIVLGYLYQRTHRLAASIAAHMLFNAYSMGLLWLQIN